MLLGRKPEAVAGPGAARRRRAGGRGQALRRRRPDRPLQPADRRCLGRAPATSSSPMASATRASPSSTRTACSSSPGARRAPSRASSAPPARSRSTRTATSTSPIGGNKRIQVFDNDGNVQDGRSPTSATPQALCITPGPNQVLYSSNSNPPNDIDTGGEIYKMQARRHGHRQVRPRRASCPRSSTPSTPSTAATITRSMSARSAICGCRSSRCTEP